MMCKFLLFLAVVAQISAFRYNQEPIAASKYGSLSARNTYESASSSSTSSFNEKGVQTLENKPETVSQYSTSSQTSQSYAPIIRHVVAKGKFPVNLQNCGAFPEKKIPIYTSHIKTPVQERPLVRLPTKIPAARTIAHTCTCYKTIVKPRVQQTVITVPSIHRYIQTAHRPVIENIHYEAFPINCEEAPATETEAKNQVQTSTQTQTQSQVVSQSKTQAQTQTQSLDSSSAFQFSGLESQQKVAQSPIQGLQSLGFSQNQSPLTSERDNFKASQVETIELPPIRFVEAPKSQANELSQVQYGRTQKFQELPQGQFEGQKFQKIEIPPLQFPEAPKPQTIEIPRYHFVEAPKAESIEAPRLQYSDALKPQTIEIPPLRFPEAQKSSPLEIPCIQLVEAKKTHSIELPPIRFPEAPKHQTLEIPQIRFPEVQKPQPVDNVQFVEAHKTQKIEVPRFHFVEANKPQTVHIPRAQYFESGKVQNLESQQRSGREDTLKSSYPQQTATINFGSEPFCFSFNH